MKRVIVAPLNWGLGHASRCVIIIKSLLKNNFIPVIAGDGDSLLFLQKEFPQLETILLPSYAIQYGNRLKLQLVFQTPRILKAVAKERKVIEDYVDMHDDVVGIISDNRFGVRSERIPSVYITHQIQVRSGWTTFLTSFVHQRIIRKFDECWIPDDEKSSLSGKLSAVKKNIGQKFMGTLSRLTFEKKESNYDLAVILSGVEPRRSQLEEKLLATLKAYEGEVVLVRGVVEEEQKVERKGNMLLYNFALTNELQEIVNTSEVVISRSGYSSIMDLAATQKKAVLIPTKGQTEQEYLGYYLSKTNRVVSVSEDLFSMYHIEAAKKMIGLESGKTDLPKELFGLFERE